ncbi:hypothetical protein BDV12DRAFT_167302 [Aspergillus spectabilis]
MKANQQAAIRRSTANPEAKFIRPVGLERAVLNGDWWPTPANFITDGRAASSAVQFQAVTLTCKGCTVCVVDAVFRMIVWCCSVAFVVVVFNCSEDSS